MAAAFIILLGMALVILLISRKENRTSPLYRSVAVFAAVTLAFCLLYFYFYFRDMFLEDYAVSLPLRILDYVLYGSFPFFWLRVLGRLAESAGPMDRILCRGDGFRQTPVQAEGTDAARAGVSSGRDDNSLREPAADTGPGRPPGLSGSESGCRIFFWAWALGIVGVLTGGVAACFMDPYYGFASLTAGWIFTGIQAVLTLLDIGVIGTYTLRFIRNATSSSHRRYVAFTTAVYSLWLVLQEIVDSCLYTGRFVSAWAEGIPDSTAPAVFLMGLATFIFLFREDFSPLFYPAAETGRGKAGTVPAGEMIRDASQTEAPLPEAKAVKAVAAAEGKSAGSPSNAPARPAGPVRTPASVADLLELAAAQHGLTVRELDVLRLVYEGRNNPEIAEALFISRNTVKKHLQNIYEKTGVNSRMELIYIINLKKA